MCPKCTPSAGSQTVGPPDPPPSTTPQESSSSNLNLQVRATAFPHAHPPTGCSFRKKTAESKNAYLTHFGSLTGDIWHVTGAHILSEYITSAKNTTHPYGDFFVKACTTVNSISREQSLFEAVESIKVSTNESIKNGRKSWSYMNQIGLDALVTQVDDGGRDLIKKPHVNLFGPDLDEIYDVQHGSPNDSPKLFDNLLATQVLTPSKSPQSRSANDTGVDNDPRVISLHCSTSIVMQLMKYLGEDTSQKILGYRLSGGGTDGFHDTYQEAKFKVEALCEKISHIHQMVAAEGGTAKGVYLFNYRVGHVNPQHDSNFHLLNDFRTEAAKQGFITIVIPQLNPQYASMPKHQHLKHETSDLANLIRETAPTVDSAEVARYKGHYLFDLLDVYTTTPKPMNSAVKACFWHLVASYLQFNSPVQSSLPPSWVIDALNKHSHLDITNTTKTFIPPVKGFLGGRSGSTDLPAFVGMRVFSWEEPLFTVLGPSQPLPPPDGPWNSTFFSRQGPQFVRHLNQISIMTVGYLDLDTIEKPIGKPRVYHRFEKESGILGMWLRGGEGAAAVILPAGVVGKFGRDWLVGRYKRDIEKYPTARGEGPEVRVTGLVEYEIALNALEDEVVGDGEEEGE
ncbi:hypothetical protein QBC40DRAFT_262687 [Triangularia verruculosa]|uniref:Uncharacterized protein n=1 Tax=Triangularia verruculosa TaxID=2587418 RepID=A0AAN6XP16_9PEZI|nr:hypothetical protein QBC40DRAFT_262687 [Triangularia verruculosa]